MNTEYIRDGKVAPYVILVAKDGSRFIPIESDCKVSYNDAVFDLITETNEATAISKLNLRPETVSREKESKSLALSIMTKVASKIQAAKL